MTCKECINPRSTGKTPTEAVMTDGCGFANAKFFELLQEKFRWDSHPTAVQVRVNGAKVGAPRAARSIVESSRFLGSPRLAS